MNPELQYKFETQMLSSGITNDRRIFNVDSKGIYIRTDVWWMYRVWTMQEAKIETLINMYEKKVEESLKLGYVDAENDFRLRGKM